MNIQEAFDINLINATAEKFSEPMFVAIQDEIIEMVGTEVDDEQRPLVQAMLIRAFMAGCNLGESVGAQTATQTQELQEFDEEPEQDGMIHLALHPEQASLLLQVLLGGGE